jgi:hypothetical protein
MDNLCIEIEDDKRVNEFYVKDNGKGIAPAYHDKSLRYSLS